MSDDSSTEWSGNDALAYIDIDDFKSINDNHGHQFGDDVIDSVLEIGMDIVPDDSEFTREYGQGDEFLVNSPDSDVDSIESVLENFRKAVRDQGPNGIEVSVSIGIAAAPPEGEEFERVKNWAEEAMRRAKEWGGNQIQIYGEFEDLRTVSIRFDITAPPGRPDDRIVFRRWREGAQEDILAEIVENKTTGARYESESSKVGISGNRVEGSLRAVVTQIEGVERRGTRFHAKVRKSDYEEIFGE